MSSPKSSPDDSLSTAETDLKQLRDSEAIKRKSTCEDFNGTTKKLKTDDEQEEESEEMNLEGDPLMLEVKESSKSPDPRKSDPLKSEEESPDDSSDKSADEASDKSTEDPTEKATEASESDSENVAEPNEESNEVSAEISKKDKGAEKKDQLERKVQNFRKNIKDLLDESQLDATTLSAQRQESERLARVQEQQRQTREVQRQIAAEKQANKTQLKVLSLLQGEPSDASTTPIDLHDPILEKFTLNSAVSITPAARATLQSIQSLISTDDHIPDSDSDDVIIQPDPSHDKSKAVVVDSSSDSDDCIILSDEEEEEAEEDDDNSGEHTNDLYNKKDAEGRVIVNVGHGENESNVFVAPQIARIIKPHQIGGVRFLFDNIIESLELFDKSSGFGCILAHSMGLGKTLQLVCFCDIFLRHTSSKSILIIMPINVLQNWVNEYNQWLPLPEDVEKCPLSKDGEVRPRTFKIFVLNDSQKTLNARAKTVLEWSKEGGVLLMGYEMYRLLSLKKLKPSKKKGALDSDTPTNENRQLFDNIYTALVNPGPDLVVCDEGHRIKNAHASTSLALKQIKTRRRIVLTGYPLQNNLLEYWCMVDFCRPSYLGTKTEFSNMFERPIQNGQCIDSTPQDCKLMRYRAHVLHSLLKGFVQRRSQAVLQKCLPEKTEFVLLIRMTPFQRKLYNVFMDEVVRSKKVPNPLKAFSVCCKIWNHPDVLHNFLKKRELDLDIELDENEAVGKVEPSPTTKKRGRKAKEAVVEEKKVPVAAEKTVDIKQEEGTQVKTEPLQESLKMAPLSNDSAYSSNQSINSSFDSSYSSYQSFPPHEASSYQNYNNYNGSSGTNGYQNWNGGNYWQQNNYYQNDYSQNYYQQNSYQSYGQPNYQSFDQKPAILPELITTEEKAGGVGKLRDTCKTEGGLLADVIKEETQELRNKDIKEANYDKEIKEIMSARSSRDEGIPYDWAVELMKDYTADLIENSPKMEIFFCILDESIRLGDRILVFSQSLLTLNILERFLQRSKIPNTETNWARNTSYFRLDGSTAALEREKLINEFNSNSNVKLFLVSTRAGSLGINLVGANRVVVFDASWNPCHDTQAVCRVYRYGQSKSCFVYRFVMDNCLEKKIYDRQINKQGMADRVVDECNPDAHLSMREVTSLCYDDGVDPEIRDFADDMAKYEDIVAKKIMADHPKTLTKEPFQHESLLVDRKEKKLSLAEKRLAQRGYEMEKQAASKAAPFNYNPVGSNYRAYRTPDGSLIHRPVSSIRPVQNEIGEAVNPSRVNPKPNKWVPVEVWQSKGLTAQEMTLPQDVSIQTNSADKSKIFLKAGQKVIVLKSQKGICLQLESGKVIAIRASMKSGQAIPGDPKLGAFSTLSDTSQARPNFPPRSIGNDIIDISNDDDDDEDEAKTAKSTSVSMVDSPLLPQHMKGSFHPISNDSTLAQSLPSLDPVPKEKVVYKPNLVQRKPKMPPPSMLSQDLKKPIDSGYSQLRPTPPKWDARRNFPNSPSMNYSSRNGGSKPLQATSAIKKIDEPSRDQQIDSTAFRSPLEASSSLATPQYEAQHMYQNSSYSNPNYTSPPTSNSYNYPYHPSFSNTPSSYHYPPATASNYNPNYSNYQGFNSYPPPQNNYVPAPVDPAPDPFPAPFPAPSTNYDQWNYNN